MNTTSLINKFFLPLFFFLTILAVLNSCKATDSIFEEIIKNRISTTQSDKLFTEHSLPKNLIEVGYVKQANIIGSIMLYEGKGVEALPYIFFAEQNYLPESILELFKIANGDYKEIPKEKCLEIEKRINDYMPPGFSRQQLFNYYEKTFLRNVINLHEKAEESSLSQSLSCLRYNLFAIFVMYSDNVQKDFASVDGKTSVDSKSDKIEVIPLISPEPSQLRSRIGYEIGKY